ncbi:AMP-binding enzyme domain-containing protein [Phthorimaea operculella]|nr:AMP-binding enzyme domain-containing protein [Phthorimaea operculella]
MYGEKRVTDACRWYIEELSSRVVAESGRACDRFHLGKLILRGLKDAPDYTLQIDGSTGESASFASVLERSVQCASAFKQFGLGAGDVIVMMAPNNINMCVPFYAALYLGVLVSPIDRLLKIKELKDMFLIAEPKIVFCTTDRVKDVQTGLDELKLKSKIVTMDEKSEHIENAISIDELLKKFGAKDNVQDFKPTDLDPEENIALLISTSGTTGLPKQACHTHKTFTVAISGIWSRESSFPSPFKTVIIISPMQWLSCVLQMIAAPIYRYTLLTSQMEIDKEHFYDLVNKYRPNNALCSPTKLATLVEPGTKDKCDMSCFKLLLVGGSAVSAELLKSVQEVAPNSEIFNAYGITEAGSNIFMWGSTVHNSVGVPDTHLQYRLIDVDTKKDIFERNKLGELWIKGPSVCKGYYKNEEATKNAFSEDGWYKTGDLLYRDEQNNFFFVDRLKMLFKYMNHQISPVEIQNVILQHPGVQDVAVTSVADQRGDLPVACVVRKPGHSVTAQEIKDLVKDSLTDTKQLRGGVVFMDKFPVTATTKVNYRELKKIVLEVEKE